LETGVGGGVEEEEVEEDGVEEDGVGGKDDDEIT
jgi:hypothetical protein